MVPVDKTAGDLDPLGRYTELRRSLDRDRIQGLPLTFKVGI